MACSVGLPEARETPRHLQEDRKGPAGREVNLLPQAAMSDEVSHNKLQLGPLHCKVGQSALVSDALHLSQSQTSPPLCTTFRHLNHHHHLLLLLRHHDNTTTSTRIVAPSSDRLISRSVIPSTRWL